MQEHEERVLSWSRRVQSEPPPLCAAFTDLLLSEQLSRRTTARGRTTAQGRTEEPENSAESERVERRNRPNRGKQTPNGSHLIRRLIKRSQMFPVSTEDEMTHLSHMG